MSLGPHLRNHTPATLAGCWPDLELDLTQARRIVSRLIAEDRDALDGVRGLPARKAQALLARGSLHRLQLVEQRASQVDPFVKFVFRAPDGAVFESVRIPLEKPRFSICVSSQVGCAMGCAFCATGRMGFARQLEPWEMVEQVLAVRRLSPERPVTGVVFQGQGEPLLNYDHVMQAIAILRDPCGGRIGADRITLSTVGLPERIARYTDDGHPYRLILSLTSASDDTRARVIPAALRHDVASVAAAMRRHADRHGGLIHLAWVMMKGVNTDPAEALTLARLFDGYKLRVSLIDVNDAAGTFEPPGDEERRRFISALADARIGFVRRYSGGADIDAACGMLAGQVMAAAPRE
ncbi:MAG: radical SAM protein [Vicinamibacteria bacterium]|nr:radical SAM protein [Vicinamibacteria bacterium]